MTPERSLGRLGVRVVGTAVGLALLYVLSFGPAVYLAIKSPPIGPAIAVVYAPIYWVFSKVSQPPLLYPYWRWWYSLARPEQPSP